MLRLLLAVIITLTIASAAIAQDTHLPLILGNATDDNTPTSTATINPFATATPTGTPTSTGTVTPTGTTTPTPTTTPTGTTTSTPTSTSTSTTTPTTTPTATATEVVNATCDCSGNVYNCSDFGTQPQAQACMEFCEGQGLGDIHQLDGNDDDGLACENLPGGFRVVH